MISLFEPLITKIELSKAQKIHRQSYTQEETLYPVPVFEGHGSWSFPIPNNIINFTR